MPSPVPSIAKQPPQRQLLSNWIEIFAIPIASALMESQPILLGLRQVISSLAGSISDIPSVGMLIATLVGFQWWANWQRQQTRLRSISFDIPVVLLALALNLLAEITTLQDALQVILIVALVIYAWLRGRSYARAEQDDTRLINTFKIGFGVMLFATFCSLLVGDTATNAELLQSIPIFFLAAFLALSFSRIAALRKEQQQNLSSQRKEGSNSWLFTLTLVWVLLIIGSFVLETLPANLVIALAGPIWWLFGLLADVILIVLSILNALLAPLFSKFDPSRLPQVAPKRSTQATGKQPQHAAATAAQTLPHNLITIILICLAVIAIVIIAIRIQQRIAGRIVPNADEEEVRENLDRQQIRRERRQQQQALRHAQGNMESLAAESARARYRTFLQSLAEKNPALQRHTQETPLEYQHRLQQANKMQKLIPTEQGTNDEPDSEEILTTLTQAYIQERYRGQATERTRLTFLSRWVPYLVEHLTTQIAPAANAQSSSGTTGEGTAPSPAKRRIQQGDTSLRHVRWED